MREVELDEDDETLEGGGVDARQRAVAEVRLLQVDQPRRAEGALGQRQQRVPAHPQDLQHRWAHQHLLFYSFHPACGCDKPHNRSGCYSLSHGLPSFASSGVQFNRHLKFKAWVKAWVKDEVKDAFRKALDREMVRGHT